MNNFEIFNLTNEKIDEELEKDFINYALKKLDLKDVEFNIIFVDNEKIKEINKEYRGINRPTDVISFALEEGENPTFEFGRVLGDIYISVDKIHSQAKDYGHSEKREMAFLTIHGLLHILGYDHIKKEDEIVMFKKQEEILSGYGLTR